MQITPLWVVSSKDTSFNTENLKAEIVSVDDYGNNEYHLMEVKGDIQPVGSYSNAKPFTTHTIELVKDDCIYLFSDGYQDQFGGENVSTKKAGGKKFKAKNQKKLFLSLQKEKMDYQKDVLESTFDKWKGELEQLDDVCIIGVKI